MDRSRLQTALTLAETGSLRKTAERLHASQSALSDAIRGLEQELGCSLFERSSKGMKPVSGSESVFSLFQRTLDLMDQVVTAAEDLAQGATGRIRILAVHSATETVIPNLYRQWDRHAPGITLSVDTAPPHRQVKALAENACDVGIMRGPMQQEGLVVHRILNEGLVAVLPEAWTSSKAYTSIQDLDRRPFVHFGAQHGPGIRETICSEISERSLDLPIAGETDSMAALLSMVAGGIGWALVPASMARRCQDHVATLFDPSLPMAELIAVHREGDTNPALQRFLALIPQIREGIP